jgi:hypothetical protein
MKKHFLLLVMALMSISAWALDLDGSKFLVKNVEYGGSTNPSLKSAPEGYASGDYEIDFTKWYTDEACTTIATDPKTGAAYTIGTLPVKKYYLKIVGHADYAGLTAVTSFNVLSVTVNIAFSAASITYGEANPASYTPTLTKGGAAFANTDNILGLTTGRKGTNDAGAYDYTFEWTNKNFDVVRTDENKFTIEPKNIGSGAAAEADKATITKEQGDVVYTGNEIIGVYTIKAGDKTLTAGTAPVLYTLAEYNAAHPTATVDESGYGSVPYADKIKTPGTGDYYVAAVKNASPTTPYKPIITFQGNYTGTLEPTTGFKVAQAPITVIVTDMEVPYNNTDQKDQTTEAIKVLDFAGLLGDDILNATTLKTSFRNAIKETSAETSVKVATEAKDAGEYTLTLTTNATGAGNYAFTTFLPGKLTIKPIMLTIKADPKTIAVGAAEPDPASYAYTITDGALLSATGTGAFEDALSGITFTRDPGTEAGEYALTPDFSAAVVTRTEGSKKTNVTKNYDFKAATPKGVLTITEGSIVVTIKDANKFYGKADPETFEYTVTGLQGTDVLPAFTPTRNKTAENPEAVGAYAITATVENPNPKKYASVVVVPGIFTIKHAELEITMPVQNITNEVGTATTLDVTKLTKEGITAKGINNDDDIKDLITLGYNGTSFATNTSYDNGYTATLTTDAAKKYKFVKVNGKDVASPSSETVAHGKLIVGTGTGADITLKRADKADIDKTAEGQANDAAALIAKNNGETVNVKFGDFKMLPEKWYPIVLPFETTVSAISSAFGYAVVNVLNKDNTDASKVSFKLHMGTLPANTPFVVKVYGNTADKSVNMKDAATLTGQIVAPADYARVTTAEAQDKSGITFIGTYTGKTDGFRANQWYFSASADYNQYYPGNETNTTYLRPLGAYLEATTAGARILEFEEADGTITAISSMKAENEAASAEGWYTIGGVKLEGAPSQKGIYIQNGKKVIVK